MAIYPHQSSPLGERLRYYILRVPGNQMVPLVPVDQLPFQLQGIPRQLNHRQMSEGGWRFIDETAEPNSIFPTLNPNRTNPFLRTQPSPIPTKFLAPDHHVREELSDVPEARPNDSRSRFAVNSRTSPSATVSEIAYDVPHGPVLAAVDSPMSLTDSLATIYSKDAQRVGYQMATPSGIEPDYSKKEYCSHWIKTGECAFTAVGCKYKHEMPSIGKLRELGFNAVPRWFKEKSAIDTRGLTWMQRRMIQAKESEGEESENPTLREFPDPSTLESSKSNGISRSDGLPKEGKLLLQWRGGSGGENGNEQQDSAMKPAVSSSGPLIDIEVPAPLPSPPTSISSASAAASSVADPSSSSRSSPSPPTSPRTTPKALESSPRTTHQKSAKSFLRRHSQLSWSSDDVSAQAARQVDQRKAYPKKGPKQTPPAAPACKVGLARSKHASLEKETGTSESKASKRKLKRNDNQDLQSQIVEQTHQSRQHGPRRTTGRKASAGDESVIHTNAASTKQPDLL